ncbi:hypothetical protein FSHL1_009508 [Fusarium sambucinum]
MAKFGDLPVELVNDIIIDRLPRKSLASLRLCWPHLYGIILPLLFHKIHITFAQRHIEILKAVASSPRIAPHVQEIVFFIVKSLPSCEEDRNTDDYIKGYSQAVRHDFFMSVDALPNLRTFTSQPAPENHLNVKEDIDGLLNAILPALCRPSCVTSLRFNLEELSVRWKGKVIASLPSLPGLQLEKVFNVKLPRLRTIKLAFVRLTLGGEPFQEFIKRHAATLRHIMLCQIDSNIPELIRFAARNPEVQLHRFVVFPDYDISYRRVKPPPVLIREKSVLEYINSNSPEHQNPLAPLKASSRDPWGTVSQRILPARWPEQNNGWMRVACKECGD